MFKNQKEAIQNTKINYLEELGESYECDTKVFWNLVNPKSKTKRFNRNVIDGELGQTRDPVEITKVFKTFYEKLYSHLQSDEFKNS